MANIQYSNRNNPTQTQGTVEPIKVQVSTQGANRSNVGMTPRSEPHQAPAPAAEAPVEAPKVPSPAEDPGISAKFAALARKEKALRQKYAEIASKEQELTKYREEAEKAVKYRERLKSDPLDVLNEEGVTYDQLVQKAVNYNNPINNDVMALQKQIKALEATLQKQNEESQHSQKAQREQAERQISMDVKELISSVPEFKAIKDMGADEAVTQLITTTYDEDGILLTTEQAAKQVKDYLLEEAKRITSILNPQPLEQALQQQVQQPIQKNTTKTLSNTMIASEAPAKNWAEKKARIVAKYSKK